MKPVYQTVNKQRCRPVCQPVTTYCTYRCDMGHWQTPAPAPQTGCCQPCPPPCPVWVPNIVEKKVPVTRYVWKNVMETVPVQVCKMVPQQITRSCNVPVCKMVPQTITRQVPRVTCQMVTQQMTRQVPYCVCRQVPYTVQVRVPRCVPRPCNTGAPQGPAAAPVAPQSTDVNERLLTAMGQVS
ncbi:MAG TPA: hypothetical protein VF306_14180 [Pirellulales bacterium]